MSQKDLIQFISHHFDEGKNQDDVRLLARRHQVTEEAYAAALVTVLSQRLTDDTPRRHGVPPMVLGVAACVLIVAGITVVLALHGEFAAVVGSGLIVAGLGMAVWMGRKHAANR